MDHRYIKEDVGFGLVPMTEIGHSLGVKTPVMDALITLASAMHKTDYRAEGLTLKKMGLGGGRQHDIFKVMREGF